MARSNAWDAFPLGLLLFILLPHPAGASETSDRPPAWTVEDPRGDVEIHGGPGLAAAPLPGSSRPIDAVDTISLSMVDLDEADLRIQWTTAGGFRPERQGSSPVFGLGVVHAIHFQLPSGGGAATFGLVRLRSETIQTPQADVDVVATGAEFCFVPEPVFTCYLDRATPIPLGFAGQSAFADLPKRMLVRGSDAAGQSATPPDRLVVGARLTNIAAESFAGRFLTINGYSAGQVADAIPNQGALPDFVFSYPSLEPKLEMRLGHNAVVAGERNHFRIPIHNPSPGAVQVALVADADNAPGWSVTSTRSVLLKPGATVNATLSVHAPPVRGEQAEIRVRAVEERIGHAVVGLARTTLVAVDPLDASYATWWVHATPTPSGPAGWSGYRPGRTGTIVRVDDAAQAGRIDLTSRATVEGAEFTTVLTSGEPLPNRARVTGAAGEVTLALESQVSMSAQLLLSLQVDSGEVASASSSIVLPQGLSTHELPLHWVSPDPRLGPDQGPLQLHVRLLKPGADGLAYAVSEITVVPGASKFALPLARDHGSDVAVGTSGLVLAAAEETHAAVNPGRSTVFDVDMRNQGGAPLRVRLGIEEASGAWLTRLVPDRVLELLPDDEQRVAVVVAVPTDAAEGEWFRFRMVALDASTQEPMAGLGFSVQATSGVDVPDEWVSMDLDQGAPARSPAPVGPLLLAAIGIAVSVVRRKRPPWPQSSRP